MTPFMHRFGAQKHPQRSGFLVLRLHLAALLAIGLVHAAAVAQTIELPPTSAIGFENDYQGCGPGPTSQDVTVEVSERDHSFAPRVEGCVLADYFATGLSQGYLDAISAHFDLQGVAVPSGAQPLLRIYVRKGSYAPTWHALKLLPGSFNHEGEDCDAPSCWSTADEFQGDPHFEGWVTRYVPLDWLNGLQLDLTVRIWNASVDAIVLTFEGTPPAPGSTYAYAFENEYAGWCDAPVTQEVTSELATLDGVFAPRLAPCVAVDYLATGSSPGYLDALAIHFDLSAYPSLPPSVPLTLRLFLQKGDYWDTGWHAVRLYPGLFNAQDEDCDLRQSCWTTTDEFPGDSGWTGWVERAIPEGWAGTNGLDLTVRVWNARVDAAELIVNAPTNQLRSSWGALKARYR
jgi:hypothetical protein